MAVSTGSTIVKSEVVAAYQNIINSVFNYATYSLDSKPYFSGLSQQAVPDNQMTSKSIPSFSISGTTITASTLWSAIQSMATGFNKVRKFSSTRYLRISKTTTGEDYYSATHTASGSFVADASFPTPPSGWARSGTTSITITPTNYGITSGTTITASHVTNTLQSCYNDWQSKCVNNNTITYELYVCHDSCYSNCHDSRGRR